MVDKDDRKAAATGNPGDGNTGNGNTTEQAGTHTATDPLWQPLQELISRFAPVHGPSGSEENIRQVIAAQIKPFADETRVDALGNLIAVQRPQQAATQDRERPHRLMLAAHMDEVGIVITHIDDEGFLRFSQVGSLTAARLPGQRVVFANGTMGVIGLEKLDKAGDLKMDRLFVDIGATSENEAGEKVTIGDMAALSRGVDPLGQRVVGKALDDRAGCAVLAHAMQELHASRSFHEIHFVFSAQEELGARGARTAAYTIAPDLGLAIDVTPTGDIPERAPFNVSLGKGAAIKVKDGSLITHPAVKDWLVALAETENIPYQMEVLQRGGTDAGPIHTTKDGIPAGVISIPTRYLHSPAELVDLGDMAAATRLLLAAARSELPLVSP